MSVAKFISTTSLTKVYLALDPLAKRPEEHWDFAAVPDPGLVYLTVL